MRAVFFNMHVFAVICLLSFSAFGDGIEIIKWPIDKHVEPQQESQSSNASLLVIRPGAKTRPLQPKTSFDEDLIIGGNDDSGWGLKTHELRHKEQNSVSSETTEQRLVKRALRNKPQPTKKDGNIWSRFRLPSFQYKRPTKPSEGKKGGFKWSSCVPRATMKRTQTWLKRNLSMKKKLNQQELQIDGSKLKLLPWTEECPTPKPPSPSRSPTRSPSRNGNDGQKEELSAAGPLPVVLHQWRSPSYGKSKPSKDVIPDGEKPFILDMTWNRRKFGSQSDPAPKDRIPTIPYEKDPQVISTTVDGKVGFITGEESSPEKKPNAANQPLSPNSVIAVNLEKFLAGQKQGSVITSDQLRQYTTNKLTNKQINDMMTNAARVQ